MLQIASGKLFSRDAAQRNELRGVLYTNLQLYGSPAIETAAGRLLSTESMSAPGTVVYEITELIEDEPQAGGLVSHGAEPYLSDFGLVVSFALNAICTPDPETFRRLTSGLGGSHASARPRRLVSKVFDEQIWCGDEQAQELVQFTEALIGLKRKDFLASFSSMKTYVTALHRLGDDPELAYMLLVASIESLSEGFDGGEANWSDYPEEKRIKLDRALEGTDNHTTQRVRSALLGIEHVSISRRYRRFALDKLTASYFRDEAVGRPNPAGRADLPEALKQSYELRSKYLHRLRELPALLSMGFVEGDIATIDDTPMLTFEGLSRITRHTIKEHIQNQPKVDKEPYDYRNERAGILLAPMAPQYWIGNAENFRPDSVRRRLKGHLSQLASAMGGSTESGVTDMGDVLVEIERHLPTMRPAGRRDAILLHRVFNRVTRGMQNATVEPAIVQQYSDEIDEPCIEAMLLHLLLETTPEWSLNEYRTVHDDFLHNQGKKSCLKIPRLFRSHLSLAIAERYRQAGHPEEARALISVAIENDPGRQELLQLESSFDPHTSIPWRVRSSATEGSSDFD